MLLSDFFTRYPSFAVAFSGGVDSAYLLLKAKQFGIKTRAYYAKIVFQPEELLNRVENFAKRIGVSLKIIHIDLLSNTDIVNNTELRCYYCKKAIMSALRQQAVLDGFSVLADGTNADDNTEDRPGTKALKELSILSPLAICAITKKKIRTGLKENNISFWNIPSYSCLATRIPHGTPLSLDLLEKINRGEQFLAKLGFIDYRLRYFYGMAKLEIQERDMSLALEYKDIIFEKLSELFYPVVLDLKPRVSGE